jgi:hypothetical protein
MARSHSGVIRPTRASQFGNPNPTDRELLDSLLLWSKLRRTTCRLCRAVVATDPLVSQITFTHRWEPETLHACLR